MKLWWVVEVDQSEVGWWWVAPSTVLHLSLAAHCLQTTHTPLVILLHRIIVPHDGDNEIVINQPENSSNMTTGELQNTGGSVKGNKYCQSSLKYLESLIFRR